MGPYQTPRKPEHLPARRHLLLFCSLSSGRSASAQRGTHSSHVTHPAPLRGRRAALHTPHPCAEPGQGEGSEFGGARVQVGAASRGWNQTGAEGPQGRRATWKSHMGAGGSGLLASRCDKGLSTGGAAHVLPARTSVASLCLKGSMLGTSLVVRWRPVRGTRVRSLVWEHTTCLGAVRPMCHNY